MQLPSLTTQTHTHTKSMAHSPNDRAYRYWMGGISWQLAYKLLIVYYINNEQYDENEVTPYLHQTQCDKVDVHNKLVSAHSHRLTLCYTISDGQCLSYVRLSVIYSTYHILIWHDNLVTLHYDFVICSKLGRMFSYRKYSIHFAFCHSME